MHFLKTSVAFAGRNGVCSIQQIEAAMARIRRIIIANFRCIKQLTWVPSPGVNCLIGPGDSGKSTILDAIDYCLGARRNLQFSDAISAADFATPSNR
jgi:putative ATP-dependent endonuclease of the OLD family